MGSNPPTPSPTSVRSTLNNINTVAGTGTASTTGNGGPALSMTLNAPNAIWVDSKGNVYTVEGNPAHCVRKFSYPNGIVSVYAGTCGASGLSGDNGQATSALLNWPQCAAVNTAGVMYICDVWNVNNIRRVSTSGIITTVFGTGASSDTGDGGPATSASVFDPFCVWFDTLSQVYVCSRQGNKIRMINTASIVSTVAGKSIFVDRCVT